MEAALTQGANAINVTATDQAGNRKSIDLTVTYLAPAPLPFVLIITEPADQSVVTEATVKLSGRTGPEAIVTVRGVSILVDELGIFSTVLTVEAGPNIIDVVAANNDGRILSAVIAVIYRPR